MNWAHQAVEIQPFRESGYRQLMIAHAAGGNRAEALRVYDRCRRLLADELGAFPSPETEAIYRELLAQDPASSHGVTASWSAGSAGGRHRVRLALGVVAVLAAGAAAGILALAENASSAPPIRPDSLIRVDPTTLKATEVASVGHDPDLVVASGGYLWVTNDILRGPPGSSGLVDDRTLTRVDPTTHESVVVGGGLAPCGLAPDPSGDVWVANCYPRIPGLPFHDDVVRLGARKLDWNNILAAPGGAGYFRGLAYGDGSCGSPRSQERRRTPSPASTRKQGRSELSPSLAQARRSLGQDRTATSGSPTSTTEASRACNQRRGRAGS